MTNPAPQHHHNQNPGRIIQKPDYLVRAINARLGAWAAVDKRIDLRANCKIDSVRKVLQQHIDAHKDYALLCDRKLNAAEDAWESQKADPAWQCTHPAILRETSTTGNQSFTGGSYDDTQADTVICGVCGKVLEE